MNTAPNPLSTPTGEFSATLLRLRAVASDVARRRVFAVLRQPGGTPPRPSARLRGAISPAAALVGLAVVAALGAGYGYFAAVVPVGRQLASALGLR